MEHNKNNMASHRSGFRKNTKMERGKDKMIDPKKAN